MQFIPATWRAYGIDGNGDGVNDPFNINDAALGAAHYLCVAGGNLRTDGGLRKAVLAYNHSDSYVNEVLALARAYASGIPVADIPIVGNTTGAIPAPRSYGGSGYYGGPAAPGPAIGRTDMTPPSGPTTGQSASYARHPPVPPPPRTAVRRGSPSAPAGSSGGSGSQPPAAPAGGGGSGSGSPSGPVRARLPGGGGGGTEPGRSRRPGARPRAGAAPGPAPGPGSAPAAASRRRRTGPRGDVHDAGSADGSEAPARTAPLPVDNAAPHGRRPLRST